MMSYVKKESINILRLNIYVIPLTRPTLIFVPTLLVL